MVFIIKLSEITKKVFKINLMYLHFLLTYICIQTNLQYGQRSDYFNLNRTPMTISCCASLAGMETILELDEKDLMISARDFKSGMSGERKAGRCGAS